MLGLGAPVGTLALSIAGALLASALLFPLAYLMREGLTPAYVLAARQRGIPVDAVPLSGALAAYTLGSVVLGTVFGITYLIVTAVGIGWLLPPVAAGATVTSVAYFLFTRLVLPAVELDVDRARLLKLQLLATAFLYGMGLMILVPTLALAV